jgi:hypothetical protein
MSVNVLELKRLQHEQSLDQQRLLLIGMKTGATAPVTAAFHRELQNDNVMGLAQLATHQARAYRAWLARLTDIDRRILGSIPVGTAGESVHSHHRNLIGPERLAA